MMKLWLFILLAMPLSVDAIECSVISEDEIKDIRLVMKKCAGKATLGSNDKLRTPIGFNQSDFDALFGKVKTLRMGLSIEKSDIENMVFPVLTKIDETAKYFSFSRNNKLRSISFPKMEKFPKHMELWVIGNPLLSEESAQKLKDKATDIEWSEFTEFGDCSFFDPDRSYPVDSVSELDGCKTVSSGIDAEGKDFTGTTNAVISRVDRCIFIKNTNIDDISFLKLTEQGRNWSRCKNVIEIVNNPKLCTSDFEESIDKFDWNTFKKRIENNKDKAVCEKERKQKELERLEASKTTETVTTTTTAPEVNDSPNHPEMDTKYEPVTIKEKPVWKSKWRLRLEREQREMAEETKVEKRISNWWVYLIAVNVVVIGVVTSLGALVYLRDI